MPKKSLNIPVNNFGNEPDEGITIDRISFETLPPLGEWQQPERHDRHSFFLVEAGNVCVEIDFQQFDIQYPALIYMHPDQVHRIIGFKEVVVCAWAMRNEDFNNGFLKMLEEMTPTVPQRLNSGQFKIISETARLMMDFYQRKNAPLYHSLLKEQGNALIGLTISLLLENTTQIHHQSRQEQITKAFRKQLGLNFIENKSPAFYAKELHISVAYLNECVKSTTGNAVSRNIQERVILEAKRQLYHTDLSLKEVAALLGYDDYPYFSRLFTKLTGMSPIAFKQKNRD